MERTHRQDLQPCLGHSPPVSSPSGKTLFFGDRAQPTPYSHQLGRV